jgi:pimeloyl-ACP methyl ester carboxylesterase
LLLANVLLSQAAASNAVGTSKHNFTYVIVHGAWAGGWAFKEVDELLTADGHDVYRPTLSGQGERSHLAAPNLLGTNIDLSLHIQDVVNLILWENLSNVVLVGHSYGGMVITGVADSVPGRLNHVIYLDAFLPTNGESLFGNRESGTNRGPAFFNTTNGFIYLRNYDPNKLPPREVPHPLATVTQRIMLTNQEVAQRVPTTYILTVDPGRLPEQDMFYRSYNRASDRGWKAITMEGDHNVMWTKPKELAALLENVPLPPAASSNAPLPRTDANGNPLRRAPSGHVSNYDESKVGNYSLPDPLVMLNGKPVRNAGAWEKLRRPEILKLYQTEIYGRVPEGAPKVKWSVTETDKTALNGEAVRKQIVGRIGKSTNTVNVTLYLPAKAAKPVPVFLHLVFFGGGMPASTNAGRPRFNEAGPITNILARGYGYAMVRYTEFEGDSRTNSLKGVRAMALAPGQTEPAPDEWGTISAWAWGASRVLDYLETDRSVDGKRVGLIGHSRLGKTALWAGAKDPRFAIIFSSCSGEMGASLARRDFGETVDDMAANFPWQFAGNFQKYSGRWNDMPVDSHMLIALSAPRPVFVTGGTQDQWADPHGEFLAEVAAGPVYRLLGEKDLGTTEMPLDKPLIEGSLGFHYHTGGHTITPADWNAFLDFADRHLK